MPARPIADETLRLIAAVRDALAEHLGADAVVDERTLFGGHAFMVHEKLCIAVKGEDLLVRLPPAEHEATAETPGLRELDPRGGMRGYFWVEPDAYATRAQWQRWIGAALAFNPQAKASPRRHKAPAASSLEVRRKNHGP
ncbi:TfoX/Sxy family protein [Simplicispira hankyongi]|uniref:Competence protein TfoX n=1 Tax=Simplicispira hankyongi TaxID=2315688 RepID=A0A398CAG7_9BURK|nr:TfoX/Sxy family protein [Simplicispira hankyongi]RID99314.1 competence protein TfoX [Simplicispira hankyongi]